jgi:2-polyprenyl-6-hydroxyphenyl methylase/3-demethylubiquinone-9 3-methyltransferase
MISAHETEVTFRFDALHWRFKASVDPEDYRLRGIRNAIGPVDGMRILDLGCGKGRFARAFQDHGAEVTGIDLSSEMLSEATGVPRVRGSARSLPFRSGCFDAVLAVEVFEHLAPATWRETLGEARRVLTPRGTLAVVDKSLASWNAQRPWVPSALLKRIDERRGRWMYPADGPVRERWFWPSKLRKEMLRYFADVRIVHLLSPDEEGHALFRKLPAARLMALWVARSDGGANV